jgi:hypothetical protein
VRTKDETRWMHAWIAAAGSGCRDRAGRSSDEVLDDACEVGAGVGEAVEVVLALAAWGDDSPVAQEGEVMADGGLTLA